MPDTFENFRQQALDQGFTEVLERHWAPSVTVAEHTHPFEASALMVAGEMWLTLKGETRHLLVGDRFEVPAETPHAERYGADGAVFWVARR